MPRYKAGDRVHYRYDENCTGTVVNVQQTGYGYHGCQYLVEWDAVESNDDWYSEGFLAFIPVILQEEKEEVSEQVSQAIWCDKGGHAFSAKDPDREHYTSTRNVQDGQIVKQVTAELDICGPCSKEVVLFEPPAITQGTGIQDKVPEK